MFDTMVITKTVGALCGALLVFLLGKWVADVIYQPGSRHLDPAFVVAIADEPAVDEEEVAELTLAQALANADARAGEALYPQCRACHSLDEGRLGVGPYLHNVLGREIGTVQGFNYSGALPEGETWSYDNLSAFLESPRAWAPGTSMAFAGMPDIQNRANLIAFLIEQSPDYDYVPPEVEEPVEEAPTEEPLEEEAAPADEAAADSEIAQAYAQADAARGQTLWRNCMACHVADSESNRVGPHLYGVMGREVGAVEGFRYSGNLPEGVWGLENMSALIENPREYAPGTTMAFAGVAGVQDRADIIAYMVSVGPEDAEFEAPTEEAPTEEAPAEEAPAEEAPEDEAAVEDEAAAESEIAQAYAQADAARGQTLWRNCMACHVADSESNRVGPHLYGVMGREVGAVEGFRYSGNLPEGVWGLENMSALIENPREYAPGTTMAFAGVAGVQDRADIIAYIVSVGPEDAEFEAPTEEAPAEEAPAEEAPAEEAPEEEAAVEDEAAADSEIAQAYAQADPAAGQTLWRNCMACHVADSESNRVGPHLYGVMGREIGTVEGFRYSGNLPEGVWGLENMSALIENPREFAPGTTMVFPGIADLQDRANIIAYIESVGP
jgi:cytochrome c2